MTIAPPKLHAGQALAESCVVLLAFSPLFLLIPLLGKFLDLAHTAQMASRYVAFESVAHDPLNGRLLDDEIAADVARRFFNRSDAPIKTRDAAGASDAERNPLWVDQRGEALLPDPAAAVAVTTRAATRDPFPAARRWWNDAFDLRGRNLITAAVSVQPTGLPRIQRQTGLLVDDWGALGTADIKTRIEHAGPSVIPSEEIDTLLEFAGQFPRLLTDDPLHPGLQDWEVVPCDRLAGGCPP
jgi:hypothetical protein